ncbi:MAG: hypothetical protein ACI9FR_000306 [Cryomorphaceae bacterium]|jgi:hypothetical protein
MQLRPLAQTKDAQTKKARALPKEVASLFTLSRIGLELKIQIKLIF